MKQCGDWTSEWLDHMKAIFSWFSRSPSRKSSLKSLHSRMSLLRRVVTWKMCYPKYYCPTRWIGLATALHSYLNVQDLLLIYVDNLVDSGYLPYRKPEVEPAEGSTCLGPLAQTLSTCTEVLVSWQRCRLRWRRDVREMIRVG